MVGYLALFLAIALALHFEIRQLSNRFHSWVVGNAVPLGAYRSLFGIAALPTVVVGGVLAYVQVSDALTAPSVGLAFLHPSSAAIVAVNTSSKVVEQPKYQLLLFNLDDARGDGERLRPLPFRVAVGDYIQPRGHWGPNTMMGLPAVAENVRRGDRIVGWASVRCPTCETHYYWLYLEHGLRGWYSKLPDGSLPDQAGFIRLLDESAETVVARLENEVPEGDRTPIGD